MVQLSLEIDFTHTALDLEEGLELLDQLIGSGLPAVQLRRR
jgi:hypothetical protein